LCIILKFTFILLGPLTKVRSRFHRVSLASGLEQGGQSYKILGAHQNL